LTPEVIVRVHEYLGGISVLVGGTADHVHLLSSLHRSVSLAEALRNLKSRSSAWINQDLGLSQHFAWQEGYGAFAISYGAIDSVKRYIEWQEEHHRTISFQEEFLDFLRRHDIGYDERYIWA